MRIKSRKPDLSSARSVLFIAIRSIGKSEFQRNGISSCLSASICRSYGTKPSKKRIIYKYQAPHGAEIKFLHLIRISI